MAGGTRSERGAPPVSVAPRLENLQMQALRRRPIGQTSAADEPAEREAQQLAERVARPEPEAASAASPGMAAPPETDRNRGLSAAGEPLPPMLRALFEPRLGADLSGVRIHRDAEADLVARAAGARAFALGSDIGFAGGQWSPESDAGRLLLAHELAHVLDSERGAPRLRRSPEAPSTGEASPEQRYADALARISTDGIAAFRAALDAVDEDRVRKAGQTVLLQWEAAEAQREALPIAADASAPVAATPGQPAAAALPAPLQAQHDRVQKEILTSIGTQYFAGTPVGSAVLEPKGVEDLGAYIFDQTATAAWVVKDTSALLAVLGRDNPPEADQWTAVGLLRQHPNPWNFGYMLTVVAARGLSGALARFGPSPREALTQLSFAVAQLLASPLANPADQPSPYALLVEQSSVRLVLPQSPIEVAAEFYGDGDRWADVLRPYNAAVLAQSDGRRWLPAGTELVLDGRLLVPRYRALFLAAARSRQLEQQRGTEPYLFARPDTPLVPGNRVEIGVNWPNALYDKVRLEWWVENDPLAVRRDGLPDRVDAGTGVLAIGSASENTVITLGASAPGTHQVKCRLTLSDGSTREVGYRIVVLTLGERTDIAARYNFGGANSLDEMVANLRAERERLGSANPTRSADLDKRIAKIEKTKRDADADSQQYLGHRAYLSPVRAIYVSADDQAMTVPLQIFVDADPGYIDATDYHLKLWDFTLSGSIRNYVAAGERPMDATRNLLRGFADDAPYPKGNIRFEITSGTLGYSGMHAETVTYPTDGGTAMVKVLRALSIGAMAIGVAAAFAGQVEIAVPALLVAGLAQGAAGAADIFDRLSHGDFQWDLQTGMDLLDVAAALLTAGTASGLTVTARGAGRMTLAGQMQLRIGQAQLGIMAGVHVAKINAAIRTGDRNEVAAAILHAVADGALVLVVHRAGARLNAPAASGEEGAFAPATRSMAGAGSGRPQGEGGPLPEPPSAASRPLTAAEQQTTHDRWVADTLATGMGVRPPPIPVGEPATVPPGTVRRNIATIEEAQKIYEDMLRRSPGREVGIWRNRLTGEYAVSAGTELEVASPFGRNFAEWAGVQHFHPNQANVLTYRNPAPRDVELASVQATLQKRPVTEFIEHPLPGGGRSRTAYTVTPEPFEITVEYARPDGTRVRRSYSSLKDYQASYNERTRYVDADSPEYKWILQDMQDLYGGGESGGEARTMAGRTQQRTGAEVEAAARAESMAWWSSPGTTTETRFARHAQNFNSIAATLRNAAAALAAKGRGGLLPRVNEGVLKTPVDLFIERNPGLRAKRAALEKSTNPDVRAEFKKFLEGTAEGGAREVGARTPDIVEFFLDRGEIVVTDVTAAPSPVHSFKTDFYRAVVQAMIGGRGGPRVYGLDINPTTQPIPETQVFP
jgi:hypothetical protein